jgi:hypothetical protein
MKLKLRQSIGCVDDGYKTGLVGIASEIKEKLERAIASL